MGEPTLQNALTSFCNCGFSFFVFKTRINYRRIKMIKKLDRKSKAQVGEEILFTRQGKEHEGIVYKVQDNSVLVVISNDSKECLGYENNNTVVAHKNYCVLKPAKRFHN